jgi:pyruvate,water dikinase
VAREYGIPAVVNVAGAMSVFHDGQMLHVDGDSGKVRPEAQSVMSTPDWRA